MQFEQRLDGILAAIGSLAHATAPANKAAQSPKDTPEQASSTSSLPGLRVGEHLDLIALADPAIPVQRYDDTLQLVQHVKALWGELVAEQDIAHEDEIRTIKNATKPFASTTQLASVNDPDILKSLATIQTQLLVEYTPQTTWPLRVHHLLTNPARKTHKG